MIKVKNLVKKFQTGDTELIALKSLNFEVPTGQFLALTGKSGAGKSTTLYQLSLLDHPSEGQILIDEEDVTLYDEPKRVLYRRDNFGFIFQDYALLPSLNSIENVMLPLLMQGMDRKEAFDMSHKALDQVDLADKYNSLPSQLSGGQQQRVSIARAIVHSPKILFADEPTANLDTESAKLIFDIFLDLNRSQALTIVMVTHELDYAKLAQRNIELRDGAIIRDTTYRKTTTLKSD